MYSSQKNCIIFLLTEHIKLQVLYIRKLTSIHCKREIVIFIFIVLGYTVLQLSANVVTHTHTSKLEAFSQLHIRNLLKKCCSSTAYMQVNNCNFFSSPQLQELLIRVCI
jgi:hypothetical protein